VTFTASSSIQSAATGRMHPEEEELLTVAGEELEDGQVRQGGVWGYRIGVGLPLHLIMQAIFNPVSVKICCPRLHVPAGNFFGGKPEAYYRNRVLDKLFLSHT